jgi:D-threo-aldose 1-dehydrogenase
MLKVELFNTDLSVSRLAFGTASLFNVGSFADREALLEGAYEQGFSHFDTAPYYGFGSAETSLKPFLARHRDVTITTKVGLYSPGGHNQSDAIIFARKAMGRFLPLLSKPIVDWSLRRAQLSLEHSLRRLGRDHIDLYLLHEPKHGLIATDEWLKWLDTEQRVRHFGLAGDMAHLSPFVTTQNPLIRVLQTQDSLDGHEADFILTTKRPLQMTYGYVSAFKDKAKLDITQVLKKALKRNASGSIIVFTRSRKRLLQYADIVNYER